MKRRRCLVPADLFYEWQKIDAKTKQPHAIGMKDGSMFAFAGLWETWKDKATGQSLQTYSVITTDANELMAPIHNRMPVIVAPKTTSVGWSRVIRPTCLLTCSGRTRRS
jgi:putative SOS response-associated peptidase YedK